MGLSRLFTKWLPFSISHPIFNYLTFQNTLCLKSCLVISSSPYLPFRWMAENSQGGWPKKVFHFHAYQRRIEFFSSLSNEKWSRLLSTPPFEELLNQNPEKIDTLSSSNRLTGTELTVIQENVSFLNSSQRIEFFQSLCDFQLSQMS